MVAAEQDRKFLKKVCMQQPGIRACTCGDSARQKLEGLISGRLPGSCGLNDQGHKSNALVRTDLGSVEISALHCGILGSSSEGMPACLGKGGKGLLPVGLIP